MRIAICISGQPRTWRTARENFMWFFNTGHQVDYFISTWDTNTYRKSGERLQDKKDYPVAENELEELQRGFNPIAIEINKYDPATFNLHWFSMFYTFMRSVWLKRKYELENDFLYDIVIKARFDINFFMDGFHQNNRPLNKFYVHKPKPLIAYSSAQPMYKFPTEFNYTSFDDVIFYADSPTMDILSNIYWWNKKIVEKGIQQRNMGLFIDEPSFFYGPGTLLYKYCTMWSIHPHCELPIPFYVVTKDAEDKNLNSIKNWVEIKALANEYHNSIPDESIKKNDKLI